LLIADPAPFIYYSTDETMLIIVLPLLLFFKPFETFFYRKVDCNHKNKAHGSSLARQVF
jgi:hypothetical protein